MTYKQLYYRGIWGWILSITRKILWYKSLSPADKYLARGVYIDSSRYYRL